MEVVTPKSRLLIQQKPRREREKARRKAEKEAGIERPVQKRKKVMEDHYDDCGDDMSSLHLEDEASGPSNLCYEHNDILSDYEHEQCLYQQLDPQAKAYPIDPTKVAREE